MTVAIIGLVCAAVFFLAVFGVFYLRKVKGADVPDRPSNGSNGSIFAFLRRRDGKRKKPLDPKYQGRPRPRPPQQQQQQQQRQRHASVATFAEQPRRNNRSYDDDDDEAPIPGLFDVPDYDNPAASSTSMPRVPGAAAFGDNSGRSPQQSGGRSAGDMTAINMNNPVIDRRFPENPMPTDMPSILARLQDPNIESALPRPPPPVEATYSPFYGPLAPTEAELAAYCNGSIPPPPPPPPGSTALYSVRPQHYDPRYHSSQQQYAAAMAARYDPHHAAMADHYYRQQMQAMPHPPMQHPAPMPPILGFQHPQAAATPPPQPPAPVASPTPRFGSPEEEEAWKRANRMTTSSPPAYSAL